MKRLGSFALRWLAALQLGGVVWAGGVWIVQGPHSAKVGDNIGCGNLRRAPAGQDLDRSGAIPVPRDRQRLRHGLLGRTVAAVPGEDQHAAGTGERSDRSGERESAGGGLGEHGLARQIEIQRIDRSGHQAPAAIPPLPS